MSVSSSETVDARALRAAIYGKGSATRPNLAGLIALGPRAGADEDFIALIAEVADSKTLLGLLLYERLRR